MRKLKFIIIALLTLNSINAQKKSIENDKLITCLKEEKFLSWYNVCKKEADTIIIYNNTSNFDKFNSIKISCNKVLKLQKSSIKIDVNAMHIDCQSTIVLYEYKVKNGIYKLGFLDTCLNQNMILELNSKNGIVHYSRGIF